MDRVEIIAGIITIVLFFAVIAGVSHEFFHLVLMASSSVFVFCFVKRKCESFSDVSFIIPVIPLKMALYTAAFIAYYFNISSADDYDDYTPLYLPFLTLAVMMTGSCILDSGSFDWEKSILLLVERIWKKEISSMLYRAYCTRTFIIYYSILCCFLAYTIAAKIEDSPFFMPILFFIFSSLITCRLAILICILSGFLALAIANMGILWLISVPHLLKAIYRIVYPDRCDLPKSDSQQIRSETTETLDRICQEKARKFRQAHAKFRQAHAKRWYNLELNDTQKYNKINKELQEAEKELREAEDEYKYAWYRLRPYLD
ncbi:hypothetical protein [Candidatus Liberibacter asiaticus]|uniref:hypothetical protein n=1 Tax=Liberibacter asiaticus TaxID=34021 RepID=UPI00157261DC|nr:hypothetical protein [Candidatus Liberibacter asiaticus]QOI69817.1 hypothetical protein [Liberibacter phage P-PA19-2]